MAEELLRDRRRSVRLPMAFELVLSDHYYRWDARACDLSPEGCGVRISAGFAVGKELEAHLPAQWGAPPLDVWATVAHVTRGVVGLGFDVSKPQLFEAMLDRVDRLTVERPELGVFSASVVRKLEMRQVLVAASAQAATGVTDLERRFLTLASGGRSVGDIARSLGGDWEKAHHVPFALLQRGLLRAGGASRPPPAPNAVATHANVRPAQADRYVQNARRMLESGDRRQARVNLRLAATLAPNDAEIQRLLEEAQDEPK